MSFDNNSFYDDNSTKNWQPQPTPMEDRRRRHTGKWVTAILILGLLALAVTGTVHLVRDVGVTINRSDTGFLLTVGTQPAQTAPTEQTQTAKETEPSVQTEAPAQTQQAAEELPQLTITQSPAGVPTVASDEAGALSLQEIYRRCIGSVVSIVTVTPSGKASGTGIIMSEDGYVITNHHVIESAQAVSVLTADSQEYTASVVGSDETSDLAVLKIEAEGLQAARRERRAHEDVRRCADHRDGAADVGRDGQGHELRRDGEARNGADLHDDRQQAGNRSCVRGDGGQDDRDNHDGGHQAFLSGARRMDDGDAYALGKARQDLPFNFIRKKRYPANPSYQNQV